MSLVDYYIMHHPEYIAEQEQTLKERQQLSLQQAEKYDRMEKVERTLSRKYRKGFHIMCNSGWRVGELLGNPRQSGILLPPVIEQPYPANTKYGIGFAPM